LQGNPATPPGIEGVEMRKRYYNPMRNPAVALPFLTLLVLHTHLLAWPRQAPLRAASLESHEGLTISAQPWTDAAQYKEKFSKKSPFSAGIVAIQVTFRNESDQSMKIALDQIRLNIVLSEDNRQRLQPMRPEDVADRVLNPGAKDPTATRTRLPIPIGRSGSGRDKHWSELQKSVEEAGVPSSIVAAHKTLQGLIYFDLRGQLDLLNSAHLYVPDVTIMGKDAALTYFEIDLSRPANH
jgi:hypothetical protein